MEPKQIELKLKAKLIQHEDEFLIFIDGKEEEILGQSLCASANTIEEAQEKFWQMAKSINQYHADRSNELNKWKLFQKGDWTHIGGTWFTLIVIQIYFRYGKGMKHGRYIPFSKLNISIHNYWRKPINNGEDKKA